MRQLILTLAVVLMAAALGCSKQGPVTVTPEMEAEQKQADAKVRDEEVYQQKNQKLTGRQTAEQEEAARGARGGN